jgi:D-lactate dehydrogenase
MPPFFKDLPEAAAALLVETRALNPANLNAQVEVITAAIAAMPTLFPFQFTDRPDEFTQAVGDSSGFVSVGRFGASDRHHRHHRRCRSCPCRNWRR